MRTALALVGILAALSATGCASVFNESDCSVTITSDPSGVPIRVRDGHGRTVHRGETPFTVTLPANDGYLSGMDYTLEGPHGGMAFMDSNIDGWYWGNALFGWVVGWLIVDPITGDMWSLPDGFHLNDDFVDPNDMSRMDVRR